jgi:hypothetical protein
VRTTKALGLLAFLLIGAATEVPPSFLRSDAPALEVTTSIRPVTQDTYQLLRRVKPGMYRCEVRVHDEPGSHRVWGTRSIVLAPGETGEESAEMGQLRLHFKATIAKTLDRAETVVTVTREGKIIHKQRSTTWLQRWPEAAQPLR